MPSQKRNSRMVSMPAPIGGWNVRDPLPMMEKQYAPILDNVFCLPSEIQVRKGYTSWATFTGTAETIFDYDGQTSGTEQLFAAVSNAGNYAIYDITYTGAVGAAVISGLSNARFKHSHFSTSGGLFTYIVNGADDARLYNGTTWYQVNAVSAPYAITGIATSSLKDITSFKRRLWFVEKNSMRCWYLPIDSIAGAATSYDFGPIFTRGGSITKIDTWTLDAGYGVDDYLVIFTSAGEVAVYRGTDPASATTWALTGVFYIGAPVGVIGSTCKFGGDLLIINRDGIAQMSKSLMSSRVNTKLSVTDKVQPQMAADTATYAANYGWELLLYPPQNMLLMNIPISATVSYQYVMNTISGAWSRWTGIPARCWYFANETLYFGANGYVGKMWDGTSDNGNAISWEVLPAYQNFGTESQLKRFSLARLIMGYTGGMTYGHRMELDFNLNTNPVPMPLFVTAPAATYGSSTYGAPSIYGGQIAIRREWKNATGMGYWGSLHLKGETKYSDIRLYAIDLNMESGGNI